MKESRLTRLEASSFGPFKEASLELPEKGLFLVMALNKDTGGSSGAGKSWLMAMPASALKYGQYPMTEAGNWDTGEPAQVSLGMWTSSEGDVTVQAGAKNSVQAGARRMSSAKAISSFLKDAIGVGPDMLQALTYAPQDDSEDFLAVPNAKKYEFMSTLLGLEPIEQAAKVAASAAEALRQGIAVKEAEERAADAAEREALARVEAAGRRLDASKARASASASSLAPAQLVEDGAKAELAAAQRAAKEAGAAKAAKEAEAEAAFAGRIAALEAQEERLERAMMDPGPPVPEPEGMAEIRSRLAQGQQAKEAVLARDRAREAEFRAEAQRLDAMIGGAKARGKQLPELRDRLARVRAEQAKLEASVCPTCNRQWEEASRQVEACVAKAAALSKSAAEAQADLDTLPGLERKRSELRYAPDPLLERIDHGIKVLEGQRLALLQAAEAEKAKALAARYAEVDAARQAASAARAERQAAVKAAGDAGWAAAQAAAEALSGAHARLSKASQSVLAAKAEALAAQHDLVARERDQETEKDWSIAAAGKLKQAQEALKAARAKCSAELDFAKLVGREGFLGAIVEEALAEISAEANACLRRVANVAHVAMDFLPDGGDGRGIKVSIRVRGHEVPYRSGLSGGQKSSVRLATRLAIRRVASRRAGCKLAWLILDECFNGIDPISKESVIEILQEEARDALVLAVDHGAEFKAMFDRVVTVEHQGGTSALVSSGPQPQP